MTREIRSVRELVELTDDPLALWAAQGLRGGGRAWAGEDAVLTAAPGISTRDRVAVHARSPEAAVAPAREVLPQLPRSYRPFGERPLIEAVAAAVPGLEVVGRFGWMDAREATSPELSAEWLPDGDAGEINALLDRAYPVSYARPGVPGATEWAGIRDDAGRLLAIGALAWPAPQVTLLSGIAVDAAARGEGLSLPLCATLAAAGPARHDAVALMVEDDNTPARRVCERLGLRRRPVGRGRFRAAGRGRPAAARVKTFLMRRRYRPAMLRGTYARARVVVVRRAVARTLMWIGAVGALAGLLIPSLTGLGRGALIGAGLFLLGLVAGLLRRRRWYAAQAAAAQKAAFAVTLEPPYETRRRLARGHALWLLVGIGATAALGVVAGPAAGLAVLGLGTGLQLSTLLLARWERREEKLLWARTDDGRLLGRTATLGGFVTTGPAAGNVKAVVHG